MPIERGVDFHLQRLDNLRSDRSNWEGQWEEAAARLIPAHRGTFFGRGLNKTHGQKNTELMFDATAALALQRFAAVMESLATPQGQAWHRLVPSEVELKDNRQVRLYLDEVNRLLFMHRYRPKANFVGQIQKVYLSYGAYGNGCLFVDELADGQLPGLRYRTLHLGEAYFQENHQGIVDTMYRSFRLTAAQIVEMFDAQGTVPKSVREALGQANKTTETWEIVHAVYPRMEIEPGRMDAMAMPFASEYIFVQEQSYLARGGYMTFPAPLTRYVQFAGEVYGRGPAQLVLPAIKVLNAQKRTVLKQGHRAVDPVLLAHDDGVAGAFSLRPGAFNTGAVNAQGRPLVQPLPVGNLAVGKEMMDDERQVINDAFLITLFQILIQDKSRMTATEVLERVREKGMLVAPTTGRMQAEFLGPLIERELDLLGRLGVLPPMPPILAEAGAGFNIEYDAPMSRMARAENAAGFMRSLDHALGIFQATQDPSVLDWFDFDEAMPAILDINGSPTRWTRSLEAVEELRAQRAQQMQEQQALEAAPAAASMMKTASDMAA